MITNYNKEFTDYLLDIYGQVEFTPTHGVGARLYDDNNRMVIDFMAGIAVNALGHSHPVLIEALTKQANKIWHCSNIMVNQPAVELAKLLVANSCCHKAFFCNSGTEANEAALKLARRYGLKSAGSNKKTIVSFKNSFHGRTLFAVSVGGQHKYSEDFAPLPAGIEHGIFNDLSSADELINENTAAVIVEPIQAEGGVIPATVEFLQHLRKLCDKYNAILIFDEVQTGIGRTGKLFAYQHYQVEPDIITLAKALGGGFPIGAILVKDKFAHGFDIGSHGTTFGGNPLACSVGLATVQTINQPKFLNDVNVKAQKFTEYLQQLNDEFKLYQEIRGRGLLIGAELNHAHQNKAKQLMVNGFKYGVASLIASPNVSRFTPPLVIKDEDIELGFTRFRLALQKFSKS